MLQAVYKTSPYTFYIQTQDKTLIVNTSDNTTPAVGGFIGQAYMFKFTNQLSGAIKYALSYNVDGSSGTYPVIRNATDPSAAGSQPNRYSKLTLQHSTIEDWSGNINLTPNGYWNYELIEYSINGGSNWGTSIVLVDTIPNIYT